MFLQRKLIYPLESCSLSMLFNICSRGLNIRICEPDAPASRRWSDTGDTLRGTGGYSNTLCEGPLEFHARPRGAGPYSGEHFAWRDGLDFRRPYMKIKRTPLRVWVAGRFVGIFYSGLALSDPAGRGSLIRCGPFEHLIGGLGFAFAGELGGET